MTQRDLARDGAPIGVGILGTGLAFQAIHARVLAELAPGFAVRAVWDPDAGRTSTAAQWLGARAAASCADVLADSSVDVVVIASPARFHADQAIAAMRAGKKAVLVEKPLCAEPEEAEAIASEAARTGCALFVGSMHLHDPAWLAALEVMKAERFAPQLVRSSIVLPPNARFEEWATEPLAAAAAPAGGPGAMTPGQLMRLAVLELAIHDLPLVCRLVPQGHAPRVLSARLRAPFGYAVSIAVGDVLIDLTALLHGYWQTDWTLEASGADGRLALDFTPSFVSAGSGVMTWTSTSTGKAQTRCSLASANNGYAGQWQAIAAVLHGERPAPDPCVVLDDFRFAYAVAEQASALIARENAA